MLQHTLDRSDRIIAPEQRVTIILRDHAEEARPHFCSRPPGQVVLQPANCETAAGIFLGLAHIRAQDPDGSVIIFPSDHFVYPEEHFVRAARSLARAAQQMKHWIFLLGVAPDWPDPEYGYIQPGPHLSWLDGLRVRAVKSFLEKPSLEQSRAVLRAGALWNTMVIGGRVDIFWRLGWRYFPEMMALFEMYGESVGTPGEGSILNRIYKLMPSRNFSTHLLQQVPAQVAVLEMRGVLWSDWGNAERIIESLRQIGKEPVFLPGAHCMTAARSDGSAVLT
jgi:mannose-1-phosphate guanylyltransferase